MENTSDLRVFDAVKALAFVGDLSMGQPTDHSLRTAWLAHQIARGIGLSSGESAVVREAALLRWSGCTANASGFADLLGDDVAAREAMLAMRPSWERTVRAVGGLERAISPLARIHCEVSGEVARILGLSSQTEAVLRHVFESYDGAGVPDRLAGKEIPTAVFVVALAGDLEVFARTYGIERARGFIAIKANAQYPSELAGLVVERSAEWLEELGCVTGDTLDATLMTQRMAVGTEAELIADVADLKLPWMTGFSRKVAVASMRCCARLGMESRDQQSAYRAGLLHGIGRAAVPNTIWMGPHPLPASAWEKLRLVPYWTSRAGKQIAAFAAEAEIASFGYERLDGSGYFRGAAGSTLPREGQVLGAAIMWEALRTRRPWRNALTVAEASAHLRAEAAQGRLDPEIVEEMISPAPAAESARRRIAEHTLSPREVDVLRHISVGASNKEAARALGLSPSTIGTHVESVFRKLGCSTRAAATLKATNLGLL